MPQARATAAQRRGPSPSGPPALTSPSLPERGGPPCPYVRQVAELVHAHRTKLGGLPCARPSRLVLTRHGRVLLSDSTLGSLSGDLPLFAEESPADALYAAPGSEQGVFRTGDVFVRPPPSEAAEAYALGVLLVELMLPGRDARQLAAACAACARGEAAGVLDGCGGGEVASLAAWLLAEEWRRPTVKMALAHAALQQHQADLQLWSVVSRLEARRRGLASPSLPPARLIPLPPALGARPRRAAA